MEILSVTLKNFKSHRDRHFTFQPGTNAICGENGAGKTSILEAIAWTLFNYRGQYKTEDLIHNGEASTQVTVNFISSRDQRTYRVTRCSRAGYTIFDPQLNHRLQYSRIDEEVIPWLRENLGVAPGTDLADLFSQTIGVPQGTFTVDFFKAPKERKQIFDAILKVQEYRQTSDGLLSLEKYARAEVESLERAIAQYDDALKDWDTLTLKRYDLHQDIQQTRLELHQWQQKLEGLQAERDRLQGLGLQLQQLATQLDKKNTQIQAQTQLVERLQSEVLQAQRAVAICTEHRQAYQTFLQTEKGLQELEHQRRTQERLMRQRQTEQEQLGKYQTQLATLTQKRDRLTSAQGEIARLQPLIQQQLELEQQQEALRQQLQTCYTWQQTLTREEKRLAQQLAKQTQLTTDIDRLAALESTVQQIPALEEHQQRYQQQLSRIAAAREFEAELRQIVDRAHHQGQVHGEDIETALATLRDLQQAVPLWTDSVERVLATLHQGKALQRNLMDDLQSILSDLSEQTSVEQLHHQLEQVQTQLKTARHHQAQYLTLNTRLEERSTLATEIGEIQQTLEQAKVQLAAEPGLKQQQRELTRQLTELQDPRGRSHLLQQELQEQPRLEIALQEMQRTLETTQANIAHLDAQLAPLATLSEQFQTQQHLREQHRPAYQLYLEHQQLANSLGDRTRQQDGALQQLQTLQEEGRALANQRAQLSETFDPVEFQTIQTAYQEAQLQHTALNAQLPGKLTLLENYDQQLDRLQTLQDKRAEAQGKLSERSQIEKFVKFARKAYKEAGPRITERYVHSISREADRLFRELLNRPNVALEWTRDYEIIVQEGAHSRRFINLSGGEQMCAALAVRLALLKVLADIDIAFFDEPTTNMDRPRREQLAAAIANIKSFHQLFVISHDDTFEKVTENIIFVDRDS